MGKQAIKSHGSGKKHCERLALYSKSSRISFAPVPKSQTPLPSTAADDSASTLDSYILPDAVTDAEIRWTLKNVLSSFSFRSSDGLSDLFKSMFPDSAIAQKFTLQKDKCAYYINYGIAPHFRSVLVGEVQKSEFFAASFDESLNSVIQMGQMDLVVNYWDNIMNRVCTRYLDSTFMGHSRSSDLLEHFLSALQSLDKTKLIQVWMDGPNVSWAFFSELRNFRDENDMNVLLPTGSCGLHSIHLAFKTGENSTDWGVKKILKAVYQLLHDSPARRADYIDVTGSDQFPLPFCGTRWIEDEKVALRAIDIWDHICQICKFWEGLVKSRQPSCKSYETVLSATKDPLIIAKLNFFAHIARMLQSFLTTYQSVKPMTPFLHDDLYQLLKDITSKFMKSEVLDKCKSSISLCKLDYNKENSYLKKPDIGFGANAVIKDKTEKDEVTLAQVENFRDGCRVFLKSMTCKLVEKSPLQYAIVRNAKCLNPEVISNNESLAKKRVKDLVENLISLKWITARIGDEVNSEYKRYLEKVVIKNRESFLKFSKAEDRVDEFYFSTVGGLDAYPQLCKVIKMILTLFHGQASVERGFNTNKEMLQPNLTSKSLTSQRMIYDHMKANKSSPESFVITKQLKDSVKKARSRQKTDLAEKKEQELSDVHKRKRDALGSDIKELESKKIILEKVEKRLRTDSDALLVKAADDSKNAHTYAIEARSIMEEHKKKLVEIKELEDTIKSLHKKSKEL